MLAAADGIPQDEEENVRVQLQVETNEAKQDGCIGGFEGELIGRHGKRQAFVKVQPEDLVAQRYFRRNGKLDFFTLLRVCFTGHFSR